MIKSSKILIIVFTGFILLSISCEKKAAMKDKAEAKTDKELGISTIRSDSLFDESVKTPGVKYVGKAPGANNKKFARSFENAPPMIPHSVAGLLPIKKNNICLSCHMPSKDDPNVAITKGATRISSTHISELDGNLKGELNKAYFNCSQCHAPQANLPAAKGSKFAPVFTSEETKSKSTLKIKTTPFAKSSKAKVK